MILLTAAFAATFAAIHLLICKLRFLDSVPRSRWLSAAGGVAVAYVFLHILPELSGHQETFARALDLDRQTAERWVYLVALAGLAIFYGLERAAKVSRRTAREPGDSTDARVFWLHIGSFCLYNVLIGYLLLHREETGLWSLLIYVVAMSLHFVTNDFGLREDHKARYDRLGRWLIAGAVIAGWLLGALTSVSEALIGFLFAFLAGGVVLNVLKEELPEEKNSRFLPFALGLGGYAAILLLG